MNRLFLAAASSTMPCRVFMCLFKLSFLDKFFPHCGQCVDGATDMIRSAPRICNCGRRRQSDRQTARNVDIAMKDNDFYASRRCSIDVLATTGSLGAAQANCGKRTLVYGKPLLVYLSAVTPKKKTRLPNSNEFVRVAKCNAR